MCALGWAAVFQEKQHRGFAQVWVLPSLKPPKLTPEPQRNRFTTSNLSSHSLLRAVDPSIRELHPPSSPLYPVARRCSALPHRRTRRPPARSLHLPVANRHLPTSALRRDSPLGPQKSSRECPPTGRNLNTIILHLSSTRLSQAQDPRLAC